MGLNPENGPSIVAVYLNDVLIFSSTLDEHLTHLQLVLNNIIGAELKLKPSKCKFVQQEVMYLGHVITPAGLKPNTDRIAAVKDYPTPQHIKELRQFLGLASYYRRFIRRFAKVVQPLHALTRKNADFVWTTDCQSAFDELRENLISAPVLVLVLFQY